MKTLLRWLRIGQAKRRCLALAVSSRLAELPPDVLALTLAFLTGYELLSISHACRELYRGALASDADVWKRLVPKRFPLDTLEPQVQAWPRFSLTVRQHLDGDEASQSGKLRYLKRRAVRFHGVQSRTSSSKRGGAIRTPSPESIASSGSFSFDLVFALLPASSNVALTGGILLGAQSEDARVDSHANFHQQFVYADPDGNLYCSVMRDKPIVAEKLAFERWYHVALVFDVTGPTSATQRVYLDGELVHSVDGWLHDEWDYLTYAQLGTGCISGGPTGFCDWYAFNGLVDECRFWNRALQAKEIRCLGNVGSSDAVPESAACSWSMRDVATESIHGKVSLARSTSPLERVVRSVKVTRLLSDVRLPYKEHNLERWIRRFH